MQGNDIAVSYVARYACKFEGLLMHLAEVPPHRRGLMERLDPRRGAKEEKETKLWRPHDMPLRSLLHLVNHLNTNIEIVTYMGDQYEEQIEYWLARKGAHVQCTSYSDAYEWAEDLRRDPEIMGYYTADPEERDIIGFQHVTVVRTSSTWGF